VLYLAKHIPFDLEVLQERYTMELRPDLMGVPENQDAVLSFWIEMIEEDRQTNRKNID